MQSVVGIALLVAGVVLIIFGMQASASLGSRLSELFTGAPSDRTIWLLPYRGGGSVHSWTRPVAHRTAQNSVKATMLSSIFLVDEPPQRQRKRLPSAGGRIGWS